MEKYYAETRWHVDDLKAIRPDWSDEQCRSWWEEHERAFRDILIQYGNEILSCIN